MEQEKLYCDLCKLNFTSEQEFQEHSWSMLHHRKLDQIKGRIILHGCQLCGEEWVALLAFTRHIHEEKHQTALRKWKYQVTPLVVSSDSTPATTATTATSHTSTSSYHSQSELQLLKQNSSEQVSEENLERQSVQPTEPIANGAYHNNQFYWKSQHYNNDTDQEGNTVGKDECVNNDNSRNNIDNEIASRHASNITKTYAHVSNQNKNKNMESEERERSLKYTQSTKDRSEKYSETKDKDRPTKHFESKDRSRSIKYAESTKNKERSTRYTDSTNDKDKSMKYVESRDRYRDTEKERYTKCSDNKDKEKKHSKESKERARYEVKDKRYAKKTDSLNKDKSSKSAESKNKDRPTKDKECNNITKPTKQSGDKDKSDKIPGIKIVLKDKQNRRKPKQKKKVTLDQSGGENIDTSLSSIDTSLSSKNDKNIDTALSSKNNKIASKDAAVSIQSSSTVSNIQSVSMSSLSTTKTSESLSQSPSRTRRVSELTQVLLDKTLPVTIKVAPIKSAKKSAKVKKKTASGTINAVTAEVSANMLPQSTADNDVSPERTRKYPTRKRSCNESLSELRKKILSAYDESQTQKSSTVRKTLSKKLSANSAISTSSSVSSNPSSGMSLITTTNHSIVNSFSVVTTTANGSNLTLNLAEVPFTISHSTLTTPSLSTAVTTSALSNHDSHCCEFRKKGGDLCDISTDKRFCDYHKRVVDAVEIYITKKISNNTSSISDAVSLINSPDQHNFDDSKENIDIPSPVPVLPRKRSLSESSVDINDRTTSQLNLKRFKSKAKKSNINDHHSTFVSEDSSDSGLNSVDLTTSTHGKRNKLSRFKYLRTLTSSTHGQHEMYKANLPPTVRKLLDKKQNQFVEARIRERTTSQSESESESSDTRLSPKKVRISEPIYIKKLIASKTYGSVDFESESCFTSTASTRASNCTLSNSTKTTNTTSSMLNDPKILATLFNISTKTSNNECTLSDSTKITNTTNSTLNDPKVLAKLFNIPTSPITKPIESTETSKCTSTNSPFDSSSSLFSEKVDTRISTPAMQSFPVIDDTILVNSSISNNESSFNSSMIASNNLSSISISIPSPSDMIDVSSLIGVTSPIPLEITLQKNVANSLPANVEILPEKSVENFSPENSEVSIEKSIENEQHSLGATQQNIRTTVKKVSEAIPPALKETMIQEQLSNSLSNSTLQKESFTGKSELMQANISSTEDEHSLLTSESLMHSVPQPLAHSSSKSQVNNVSDSTLEIMSSKEVMSSQPSMSSNKTSLSSKETLLKNVPPSSISVEQNSSKNSSVESCRNSEVHPVLSAQSLSQEVINSSTHSLCESDNINNENNDISFESTECLSNDHNSIAMEISSNTEINQSEISHLKTSLQNYRETKIKETEQFFKPAILKNRKKRKDLLDANYLQKKLIQLQNEEDKCLEKMSKANYRLERLKTAMGRVQSQVSLYTTTLQNINKLKKKINSSLLESQQRKSSLLKQRNNYHSTPVTDSEIYRQNRSEISSRSNSESYRSIENTFKPTNDPYCCINEDSYRTTEESYRATGDNWVIDRTGNSTVGCEPVVSVVNTTDYHTPQHADNNSTLENLQVEELPQDCSQSSASNLSHDMESTNNTPKDSFYSPGNGLPCLMDVNLSSRDSPSSSIPMALEGCSNNFSDSELYHSFSNEQDLLTSTVRTDGRQRVITRLSNSVTCMKVFNEFIFVATNKPNGAVMVFDIKGEQPAIYLCQKQLLPVNCMEVAVTTHGKYFFTGCRGGKVKGYKFHTWELYHRSKHAYGELLSFHFAFDILFVGFVNGTIQLVYPESNKVSEDIFQRLGNKRRGVTCMTSTLQNGAEILYCGSRHGMIYARSIKGDLINKMGQYRKSSTVFELRISNGCLFAVIDDVIYIYDCLNGRECGSINTNCSFVLDSLRLCLTTDFLFMIDYQSLTTIRCCDLMTQKFSNLHQCKGKMKILNLTSDEKALVFVTSSGNVIAMDIPTLSASNTQINHSFMKRRKKPRPDKVYCEACYTCYSSEELKKRHQDKYTCKICQKCFSYSTRGLSLVLERHLAINHAMANQSIDQSITMSTN